MTIHIIIKGKVQGVSFRDSSKEIADELKVRGTVENLDNGDVEIIAQGKKKALKDFVEWCQSGPPKAVVEEVQSQKIEDAPFMKNFIVKRW